MIKLQNVLITLLIATHTLAQGTASKSETLTDPLVILQRADAAARNVSAAQYEAKAYVITASGKRNLVAEGMALVEGWAGEAPKRFKADVKLSHGASAVAHELTIGCDGEKVYLIDSKAKKTYWGYDFDVLGPRGEPVQRLLMAEYLVDTPFSDEIKSPGKTLLGHAKVGSEECYELKVTYPGGAQAKWYFSVRDFLPRRVDRMYKNPSGNIAGSQLVVSTLKANPKLSKKTFGLMSPEGFDLIEDYAP